MLGGYLFVVGVSVASYPAYFAAGLLVSIGLGWALLELNRRGMAAWISVSLTTGLAILFLGIVWLQATSPICAPLRSSICPFPLGAVAFPTLIVLAVSSVMALPRRKPWAWMTMAVLASGTGWFAGYYLIFGPPLFLEGILLLLGPPSIVWFFLLMTFRDFFVERPPSHTT
jgi:hypothetical protein